MWCCGWTDLEEEYHAQHGDRSIAGGGNSGGDEDDAAG